MPRTVRFTRAWPHDEGEGVRRNFPAGWHGSVADEVADLAVADGAAEDEAPRSADRVVPNEQMTREELDAVARERGIDPAGYRTKADLRAALSG